MYARIVEYCLSKPYVRQWLVNRTYSTKGLNDPLEKRLLALIALRRTLANYITYSPIKEGGKRMEFNLSNAETYCTTLVGLVESVLSGKDVKAYKGTRKGKRLDDWLVTENDIPMTFNELINYAEPLLTSLCNKLIDNADNPGNGYYQRHSVKHLDDAITFYTVLLYSTH